MLLLVLLDFSSATFAFEFVVAAVVVSHANFGLKVPMFAKNPGISVSYTGAGEPALETMLAEFRKICSQEIDVVSKAANVVLPSLYVES